MTRDKQREKEREQLKRADNNGRCWDWRERERKSTTKMR
jgi:hypothetical protein